MLYTRLQSIIRDRARKQQQRREVEISAPYDLKLEPVNLPGVSQEEIAILREKAAASRIGVLELRPESPSEKEYHKISRPSPRLRPALASSNNTDETRSTETEARPLWY
ncbi:hypothetical protein QQS21_010318 [Conoideocrella luteorostrata]|uniref:Uncharacterized protein n=1 Tax=Conoideocrella luteorostrata TaxID=1105319 RepID=A0AAJ0CHX2_9HYPO|nr:hypothetical protein QQS21_010318 [Conoideocrella luteorostrata]